MLPPAELAIDPQRLRLAVPGLAGIAGFLLFPMLGAWFRVLLGLLEDRWSLGPTARFSGLAWVRALVSSSLFLFFAFALVRAAGQIRTVQHEAPVAQSSLTGLGVGVVFWAVYAVGVSMVSAEARRRSMRRSYAAATPREALDPGTGA